MNMVLTYRVIKYVHGEIIEVIPYATKEKALDFYNDNHHPSDGRLVVINPPIDLGMQDMIDHLSAGHVKGYVKSSIIKTVFGNIRVITDDEVTVDTLIDLFVSSYRIPDKNVERIDVFSSNTTPRVVLIDNSLLWCDLSITTLFRNLSFQTGSSYNVVRVDKHMDAFIELYESLLPQ